MSVQISEAERRALRRMAHALKVVVRTGNAGVTPAVIAEADRALEHHELMKVRVLAADRAERDAEITRLCEALGAALIQRIGHIATIYRPRRKDSRFAPIRT